MQTEQRRISLHHLVVNDQKMIGIKFYPNKIIQNTIKTLQNPRWSEKHGMVYLPNTKENLDDIFAKFKGVAWVNCNRFFLNRAVNLDNNELCLQKYRQRPPRTDWRYVDEDFLQKLELKKYSPATAKSYISHFEKFINYYKQHENLLSLGEREINEYISYLHQQKRSDAFIKMSISAIKFYYEVVCQMPGRFYDLRAAKPKETLPKVLAKEDILKIIDATTNLKHRCMIQLLYSGGLRRSELINLKITDIDSSRMVINVRSGKGGKDRVTLLGKRMLEELRAYYRLFKPKEYLFEGESGGRYSPSSLRKVLHKATQRAGIRRRVTPHILRHSFGTHLLEEGTDLRYIQSLMGHSSTKTTEIYTHVAVKRFENIRNPLDL
jgi:site-specific recombinase XerD